MSRLFKYAGFIFSPTTLKVVIMYQALKVRQHFSRSVSPNYLLRFLGFVVIQPLQEESFQC